jgi:hypothetical protein
VSNKHREREAYAQSVVVCTDMTSPSRRSKHCSKHWHALQLTSAADAITDATADEQTARYTLVIFPFFLLAAGFLSCLFSNPIEFDGIATRLAADRHNGGALD